MNKQLNFLYDKDADVLYVSLGKPAYTDYQEIGENLILRLDPETESIVGFTVLDFIAQANNQETPLHIPLQAKFERTRRAHRLRTAAEKKTKYRVRHAKNRTRAKRVMAD